MKTHAYEPIPAEQFQLLGVSDIAYVKHAEDATDETELFTIHLADGRKVGAAPDRDTAFAALRQHNLEPLSVH
jgi:hypothetical protein